MTNRFWDDDVFVPPGDEMPQPINLRGLLVDLQLEDSPLKEQAAGISAWLKGNEPNINLQYSIEQSGLLRAFTASA